MSFAHPWVLLALILPAALVVWESARRGFVVRVPVDYGSPRPGLWRGRVLLAANLLPTVVLATAVVILAGPRRLGPPKGERVLTNIEICLDVSGSMSSPLGSGQSRYEAAMEAIQRFTDRRRGDAFGLTIFGGEVVKWVPLTKDVSAIQHATPFLDPMSLPPHLGSTRIGHALEYCGEVLAAQPDGDRFIILVSDGFSSDLGGERAMQIGNELASRSIVCYMINVGGAAPSQMYEVVGPTGGQVFSANDPAGLAAIFDHINTMQPVRIDQRAPEPVDFFTPAALAGLAALGLHAVCLFGLRYTPW
ncbi:MAG: VWA domain-containing protein [Phycisphaerales bacterium]|nr:VWA domain-containing protein [Phycisphaerales bacterium]